MAPGPSFYIVYNLVYLILIIVSPLVTFAFIPFHHTINRFVFCETGEIDNLSAVGGKVFWLSVCMSKFINGTRDTLTFTSLLISRSYWFDKARFVIEGKLLLAATPPSLGAPPNSFHHTINHYFNNLSKYLSLNVITSQNNYQLRKL